MPFFSTRFSTLKFSSQFSSQGSFSHGMSFSFIVFKCKIFFNLFLPDFRLGIFHPSFFTDWFFFHRLPARKNFQSNFFQKILSSRLVSFHPVFLIQNFFISVFPLQYSFHQRLLSSLICPTYNFCRSRYLVLKFSSAEVCILSVGKQVKKLNNGGRNCSEKIAGNNNFIISWKTD